MTEREFAYLIDKYQQKFLNQINFKIKDEDISKDIFQNCCIKAWKAISEGKFAGNETDFNHWLSRICSNGTIDFFRRDKMEMIRDGDDFSIFDIIKHPTTEDDKESDLFIERLGLLEPYLVKIPEDQASVLYRHYFEKKEFRLIAAEDNLSINTVIGKSRYGLMNIRRLFNLDPTLKRRDYHNHEEKIKFVKVKSDPIKFEPIMEKQEKVYKAYNQADFNKAVFEAKLEGFRLGIEATDPVKVYEAMIKIFGKGFSTVNIVSQSPVMDLEKAIRQPTIVTTASSISRKDSERAVSKMIKEGLDSGKYKQKGNTVVKVKREVSGWLTMINLFNHNPDQVFSVDDLMEKCSITKRDTVGQYAFVLKAQGYIVSLSKGKYKHCGKSIPIDLKPVSPKKLTIVKEEKKEELKAKLQREEVDEDLWIRMIDLFNEFPMINFQLSGLVSKLHASTEQIKEHLEALENEEYIEVKEGFYKCKYFEIPRDLKPIKIA